MRLFYRIKLLAESETTCRDVKRGNFIVLFLNQHHLISPVEAIFGSKTLSRLFSCGSIFSDNVKSARTRRKNFVQHVIQVLYSEEEMLCIFVICILHQKKRYKCSERKRYMNICPILFTKIFVNSRGYWAAGQVQSFTEIKRKSVNEGLREQGELQAAP